MDKDMLSKEGINYPIKIEYFKLFDEIRNNHKNKYGIEIIKSEFKNNNIIIENKEIREITTEENKIDEMLYLLKTNQVTPITVNDIISDLTYNA